MELLKKIRDWRPNRLQWVILIVWLVAFTITLFFGPLKCRGEWVFRGVRGCEWHAQRKEDGEVVAWRHAEPIHLRKKCILF